MKPLLRLACLAALVYLQSCGSGMIKNDTAETSQTEDTGQKKPIAHVYVPKANGNLTINSEKDLIGYWVGSFKPDTTQKIITTGEYYAWDFSNRINISIDFISDNNVIGHSVVAGNVRPFKGTVQKDSAAWRFDVQEPGDDKYDGKFKFSAATGDTTLAGTWIANKKIRIPRRRYLLTKKIFKYDPSVQMHNGRYVDWTKKKSKFVKDEELGDGYDESFFATTRDVYKYNASTALLAKEDVANMKKADIFVVRNAVYARHGYSFKNQQLRAFFDKQSWYIPISADVKKDFTEIEKKNIELLLRYEKNAKEYYDEFGRG